MARPMRKRQKKIAKPRAALSDDEQSDVADLDVPMHSEPPSPGSAEDDSKAANGDIKKSDSAEEGGSDEGSDEDEEEEDM